MDETGAYYTEWSKPERKTSIQYTDFLFSFLYKILIFPIHASASNEFITQCF